MNKWVLITGASRGLGAVTAKVFAENGYNVIINYNKRKDLASKLKEELERVYKVKTYLVKCDISLEEDVKRMIDEIKINIGNIDTLVNNAGIAIDSDINEKTSEGFMKVINTNLLGTYLVSKYVKNIMMNGSIINVSSTNGIDTTYVESVDYDASKAGVISLTHNFAKYYMPNIRVNCVCPGWINTDMNKDLSPSFKREEEKRILLGRFAHPEEIGEVIYFLASDKASYINDAIIRIDGGLK